MASQAFHAPQTIDEVIRFLACDPEAKILAGGTDLIVQMRSGRIAPSAIVDLKRIGSLAGVHSSCGGFVIGAATPCTALKDNRKLCQSWPGVVEAANLIGSVQVRNRATMVGNLCNASPAADSVPALVAAGAMCAIAGPNGKREAAAEDIPVGPGKTSLAKGEFIVEIRLPAQRDGGADAYLRSIPRTEMDIAVVGAGVSLVLASDGSCTAARIAIGAVAPTVILVEEAAAALIGSRIDETALDRVADAVRAACKPIDDKRGTADYRTAMAGVLVKRTVKIAQKRAQAKSESPA